MTDTRHPAPITEAGIYAYLDRESRDFFSLCVADSLPSTNTALKAEASAGAPAGRVLIARAQSAGRGRLGRTFVSPGNYGLYMSVLLRPTLSPGDCLRLTTLTALAAAEAMEAVTGETFGIKWVNDIYKGSKKVAGILSEATLGADGGVSYAVIGIGVNLCLPPEGYPREIRDIAGTVFAQAEDADGNRLAAEILNRLHRYCGDPLSSLYMDRYRHRSVLDGQRVLVRRMSSLGGPEEEATALYIDTNGGLRVRFPEGTEETLTGGEVSVHLT